LHILIFYINYSCCRYSSNYFKFPFSWKHSVKTC